MNNFQEMESRRLDQFEESSKRVKKNVDGSLDIYRFVGNIFDLYLPKIMGYMNVMLGGHTGDSPKSKYPNKH